MVCLEPGGAQKQYSSSAAVGAILSDICYALDYCSAWLGRRLSAIQFNTCATGTMRYDATRHAVLIFGSQRE